MKMPKVGDVVELEILDHDHSDEDDVYEATLYGKVVKVSSRAVIVDSWHPTDVDTPRDKLRGKNAIDTFVIVRRAIVNWYPLRRGQAAR
jgi:hypothetical protein